MQKCNNIYSIQYTREKKATGSPFVRNLPLKENGRGGLGNAVHFAGAVADHIQVATVPSNRFNDTFWCLQHLFVLQLDRVTFQFLIFFLSYQFSSFLSAGFPMANSERSQRRDRARRRTTLKALYGTSQWEVTQTRNGEQGKGSKKWEQNRQRIGNGGRFPFNQNVRFAKFSVTSSHLDRALTRAGLN